MKQIIQFCISIILISVFCKAQSDAGATWLLISPSATMNGMGEIGVCLPDIDPISAYYNPANGVQSYKSISSVYSDIKFDWLKNISSNIDLKYSYAGINLIPMKYPFQIVINKQIFLLDLGEYRFVEEYGTLVKTQYSQMKAAGYSIATRYSGKLWKIPLDISTGLSRKNVKQDLTNYSNNRQSSGSSENIFYDTGVLMSIPLKLNVKNRWNFSLSPAFGYSISNIGDSIVFIDHTKADPSPRLARTGISLSAKMVLPDGWNLFEYRIGKAASDLLVVSRDSDEEPIRYQSGFGDIDFIKHIIQSKSDPDLEISRGYELTFLDLYSYRFGRRINVSGECDLFETGYRINSTGLLKLFDFLTDTKQFSELSQYLSIQYNYAKWSEEFGHPLDNTEFSAYNFSLHNIDGIVKWIIDHYKSIDPVIDNIGLVAVAGMNYSTVTFSDKTVRKSVDASFATGYDFGIENRFENLITGISLVQNTSSYYLGINEDYLNNRSKLTDTFHYVTIYGIIPCTIYKKLNLLSGVQLSNCIGRNTTFSYISDVARINDPFNVGLISGVDLMINLRFGLRITYNYWFRNIKNTYIDDSRFKLSGIRVNLLMHL